MNQLPAAGKFSHHLLRSPPPPFNSPFVLSWQKAFEPAIIIETKEQKKEIKEFAKMLTSEEAINAIVESVIRKCDPCARAEETRSSENRPGLPSVNNGIIRRANPEDYQPPTEEILDLISSRNKENPTERLLSKTAQNRNGRKSCEDSKLFKFKMREAKI